MELSQQEMLTLLNSPLCVNCEHRGVLHNHDYEMGTQCNVCECTQYMEEGEHSQWSPEISAQHNYYKKGSTFCDAQSLILTNALLRLSNTDHLRLYDKDKTWEEVVSSPGSVHKVFRIVKYER